MIIYGKHPVLEAINNDQATKIYILENFKDPKILLLLSKKDIKKEIYNLKQLFFLTKTYKNQGIAAEIKPYKYYKLQDLINDGKKQKNPTIVMLDKIEDPHNFGAILRIADAFGIVGIIIKEIKQVQLNATVAKVSAGAINFIKVVRVANLNNTISYLKKFGYWIVSTDSNSKKYYTDIKYNFPMVIIIGNEGAGISELLKKNSDFILKIPMFGHINSLNASNALSVILTYAYIAKNNIF
ncbi:MAG: 23S rRNA (guanosine(2251)-2'-O)-methyltransferase RlmB [Bacilli bacterium]|nr:23S rRNA (guanosine(2251)-2'-O)-methyltransferase RlmB [Bacilli bacterium]